MGTYRRDVGCLLAGFLRNTQQAGSRHHRHRERPIKIVVLTSPTTANVFLVNRILQHHNVVGMVIESPPPALTVQEKQARRRRMLQKHGYFKTLNRLLFNKFRSRFLAASEARTIRDEFFTNEAPIDYERRVASLTVANINDPECIRFIGTLAPDLIAVCGTTVIKPEVFTLAPLGAINIHTGITPDYRSADPIFWAIYNNEPEKVGVTIHFVDKGIDTGAIILQESVPLYSGDSTAAIYARCVRNGAELYLQALEKIGAGPVRTLTHKSGAGRAFYSINLGILQYLLFRWRFKNLRRRLPENTLSPTVAEKSR